MFENRYDQLYFELNAQMISHIDIFDTLCHKYLSDDKRKDQYTFWEAYFWEKITYELLSSEAYIYALNHNFRARKISNETLIVRNVRLAPISFMRAIRYSKIFIRNYSVYQHIKNSLKDINELKNFFTITDIFAQQYMQLKNEVLFHDRSLMSYGYVDLLCLTSAFFLQYDYYPSKMDLYSRHGEILSKIIQNRLRQPDFQRKKPLQQNDIKQKIDQYFKQPSGRKKREEFSIIVEKYLALHTFNNDLLDTYCYDDNFQAKLKDTYIEMSPIDRNGYIKWYSDGLKTLHVFRHYNLNNENVEKFLLTFLQDIYGFNETIEIDNNSNVSLMQLYLYMQSIQQNSPREPLAYVKKDFFSSIYENADSEDFWSTELSNFRVNHQKLANLFEKPLFLVCDFVFWIPYILSLQNITTSLVNNLLRVRFQRTAQRKEEVHHSEENLGKVFEKHGFVVRTGYLLEENNKLECDLIAIKNGHLFLLELKSTYIRTNLEEAWVYKSTALRKAAQQLKKRLKTIHKLSSSKEQNSFIDTFGIPTHFHTWIIDTSFEYDHEYFEDILKISMFELIYSLNNIEVSSVEQFVSDIEMDRFWSKHLQKPDISKESITYRLERVENLETNND